MCTKYVFDVVYIILSTISAFHKLTYSLHVSLNLHVPLHTTGYLTDPEVTYL